MRCVLVAVVYDSMTCIFAAAAAAQGEKETKIREEQSRPQ